MTDPGHSNRPDLSIVIVNRNTRELLDECLASIAAVPDAITCEVIVVDNGSSDGSTDLVRELYPLVQLHINDTNTGYALANNQGLALSTGRYLLLLNSDTVVGSGSLARLVDFMDHDPEAGACGPMLRYPDGRLQRSCYSDPSPRSYFARMLGLDILFPRSRLFGNQHYGFDHSHTAPVDSMLGAALLVRREAMDRVGMLDEDLRLHFNDFDWCLRIRKAGWKVYFVHDAEIVHHLRATTRVENQRFRVQDELVRNLLGFYRKHYGPRGLAWMRLWMTIGFGARYLIFRAISAVQPGRADPVASRFRLGMARCGLTGNPEQFGPQ
jgi:GT2 family glycosyltransferase